MSKSSLERLPAHLLHGARGGRPAPMSTEDFRLLAEKARLLASLPNIAPDMIQSFPGIASVKEYNPATRAYTMVLLSEHFVSAHLGPKVIHYVGKTDFDFWPDETAAAFYANDEAARHDREVWGEETFLSPIAGQRVTFVGATWAFKSNGSTFIARAGRGSVDNGQ